MTAVKRCDTINISKEREANKNGKIYIEKDGCVPFVITKEDYESCIKLIKATRKKELEKAFKNFCEICGLDETINFLNEHLEEYLGKN